MLGMYFNDDMPISPTVPEPPLVKEYQEKEKVFSELPLVSERGLTDPPLFQPIKTEQEKQERPIRFKSYPFDIVGPATQIILQENLNRKYLLIQNTATPQLNNDGTIQVIFEDLTGDLTGAPTRSVTITAGGFYEPQIVPTNPISIYTTSSTAQGVIVEG